MISTTVLAVCVQQPFNRNGLWFSKMRPLCTLGGEECQPADHPAEAGLIFWMLGDSSSEIALPGALYTTGVEPSNHYGDPDRCWYQAVRSTVRRVPVELVDVTDQVPSECELLRLRHFLCPWPLPPEVYVRVGEAMLGPFLIRQFERTVEILNSGPRRPTYCKYDWNQVKGYAAISVAAEWEGNHASRWLLLPDKPLTDLPRMQRDGRRDAELARWYLDCLKASDKTPEDVKALLSRRAVQKAADLLGNVDAADRDLHSHRVERLAHMAGTLADLILQEPMLIEAALGQERWEKLVQNRVQEIVAERRAQVEAAVEPLRQEVAGLIAERDRAKQELRVQKEQAERLRKETDTHVQGRLAELEAARTHFATERQRLVHDFLALQTLLAEERHSGNQVSEESRSCDVPVTTLTSLTALTAQLALVGGKRREEMEALHRSIVSRPLVLLGGAYAAEYVRRYARALGPATGVHQVVAESGWNNLEPFLGAVNKRTRRFEPAASRALEFWRYAQALAEQQAGGLQILLLRSANRSPLEVWLAKLFVAVEPPVPGQIALFHSAQVEPDDPYRTCATLSFPPNLRVVCTLEDDPYCFPVSPALSEQLGGLRLDVPPGSIPDVKPESLSSASYVALLEWASNGTEQVTA